MRSDFSIQIPHPDDMINMPDTMELFPQQKVVGVFRGFRQGGLEFRADLVLPYHHEFQRIPMHGQFMLVQLDTPNEAVLGRITSLSADGKLSLGSGEEFNIRAVQERREIPEDLREQYLRYRVNIRVLGVIRVTGPRDIVFVPSHRRLPHVGSVVAFPSGRVLQEICGHHLDGAVIGNFALGEYVYTEPSPQGSNEGWVRHKSPMIEVRFPISSLVARRTFIFARAGFGKSNLNKLLFSELYRTTPTVEKRSSARVPVGTVIFDPEGEYFWPDDKGRPGLCDVRHLQDKLVVFTPREAPSPYYGSFSAGGIRLDIRQLRPADVISIALSPERQDQQNVAKLRALSSDRWSTLVDLVDHHRGDAQLEEIAEIMGLSLPRQESEAVAARSNMTNVIGMLHDRSSQFMGLLLDALKAGKLCVVDLSQMRGMQSFVLAGIVLRRIFDHNQQEFTRAVPHTIPTIAVIEEAQAVLNERAASARPYIDWVKEGRKYDLGALLITQQPGAIPHEILNQGDNWFIFHLLSSGDLTSVRKANAHFSDDLLSSLLNEPIPGNGVFWSSVGGRPYPVSIRTRLFEDEYDLQDSSYEGPGVETYAAQLRNRMTLVMNAATARERNRPPDEPRESVSGTGIDPIEAEPEEAPDLEAYYRQRARAAIENNGEVMNALTQTGVKWGRLKYVIADGLPDTLDDREGKGYRMIASTLTAIFGGRDVGWHTYRSEGALFVKATRQE